MHLLTTAPIKHLLSLTVMVKLKVVDDGLVANPLYLKTGNEYISITSGEIFVPKITSLKTSSIKETHWQKNTLTTS